MKIEINLEQLKEAVSLVSAVASKHPTLPLLSCVLLEIQKSRIVLKATNLDVGIEATIPAKSSEEGKVALPANTLSSFISQVQGADKTVTIEDASGNMSLSVGKSRVTIKSLPPDDFPDLPKISQEGAVSLDSSLFIKGLKSVWYSASVSSIKPELSSVYVYKNDGNVTFVATDSFRLAERRIKAPAGMSELPDILIPFKNIAPIIRVLERAGAQVSVKANKNLISFESGSICAVSRVIDGVFPDYKQIIPKSFVTEVVVLKQDLLDALKISNIFSDAFNQIKFTIDPSAKLLEVFTKNNDVGENKTEIAAALTGEKIEINFNYKYIADCFQSIDADSMSLQLSGSNRPMVIRPISGDQSFMYLVMPMNR